ncbi:YaiI/YqxD family protein [Atopomonas sediminilitoris]|uniref:YaiI/YqxD family protein n=1 Tax=Atopomonas sediminilitoris TaxID=2919919 RepID=UPI001F4E824E|nr:YaiI/YqxD family protein [Atopomonas sediminilitoris]MCJ8170490.1 YaiI/YqxD family protein [Atopomonas sediminilitoris]
MATIWVDADACPKPIREILFRAAKRTAMPIVLVANNAIAVPPGGSVRCQVVPQGFDVADNEIVRQVQAGDLVVTQDIPLAAEVIEKGAEAVHPRGEPYSPDSIRSKLNMRDFNETLRASGIHSGGLAAFGTQEKQRFANTLDRYLARQR